MMALPGYDAWLTDDSHLHGIEAVLQVSCPAAIAQGVDLFDGKSYGHTEDHDVPCGWSGVTDTLIIETPEEPDGFPLVTFVCPRCGQEVEGEGRTPQRRRARRAA